MERSTQPCLMPAAMQRIDGEGVASHPTVDMFLTFGIPLSVWPAKTPTPNIGTCEDRTRIIKDRWEGTMRYHHQVSFDSIRKVTTADKDMEC